MHLRNEIHGDKILEIARGVLGEEVVCEDDTIPGEMVQETTLIYFAWQLLDAVEEKIPFRDELGIPRVSSMDDEELQELWASLEDKFLRPEPRIKALAMAIERAVSEKLIRLAYQEMISEDDVITCDFCKYKEKADAGEECPVTGCETAFVNRVMQRLYVREMSRRSKS